MRRQKHYGFFPDGAPFQVIKIVDGVRTTLTSVDTCCDGHTAHGTARLECNGFEEIPKATADGSDTDSKEPVDDADQGGASE